jgi:D-apionate oxidoisomerase
LSKQEDFMTQVALLGAGGNMGRRITRTLRHDSAYNLRLIEPAERGRALIEESGLRTVGQAEGLAGAEVVVFAVPDKIVRHVAAEVIPQLDPGTSVLFLDPAAVAADRVPRRPDIQCYVTHPTHPPLYGLLAEPEPEARQDYWGGGLATQAIVFATAWGDQEHAAVVEDLAVAMFAPISRSYRITVEQMALLEPALTETLTNGCIAVIHEGMERVVAAGVPEDATRAFLMGHLQIGIALIFKQFDWRLSEGAQLALDRSRNQIFKDDWHRIFEPDAVMESLKQITGGD